MDSINNEVVPCYWDSENDCKIHAVIDADEVGVSCDKEAVNIFVDFGNCLPDVLENVIDWLKHSKLKIKKIIVR